MFQAVVFDIGQTLIDYEKPLNWSSLYRPAFEQIEKEMGCHFSESDYQHIMQVLTKYNTRVHPREYEVSSTQIFTEILRGIPVSEQDLPKVKHLFFSFFRQDGRIYPEAPRTLLFLSQRGIRLATLSDTAYGMDNPYVLEDIQPLLPYIDFPYTSNDTGFRKPSAKGLLFLAAKMGITPNRILFVGDEEKDMLCANTAGACSVLINRDGTAKNFGQQKEIRSLSEIPALVFP